MSVNFNDALALIRRTIQTSTDTHAKLEGKTLNEIIGGRVVSAALLDADAATFPRPSIIVDMFGGSAEYSDALEVVTVYIYAYDDTNQGRATDLYEAAHKILQGVRLWDSTGNVSSAGLAFESSRPISGHNTTMKSWFARGSWTITLA